MQVSTDTAKVKESIRGVLSLLKVTLPAGQAPAGRRGGLLLLRHAVSSRSWLVHAHV